MKNTDKTNKQLLTEIEQLSAKITKLEKSKTEHKQAEKALKESEERFRTLSESAFEGIVITYKGRICDANKKLAEMLKINLDDFIGMNVIDFIAPESRETVEKHKKSDSEEPYEHFARRNDGYIFPVEVRTKSLPFKGQISRITAIRDITESRQAEESLQSSEERLKIIFESAPDAIYLTDLKGTFIDGNKAAEDLMGYKKDELIGKSILKLKLLSAKEIRKATKLLVKNVQGKGTGPDEFMLTCKNGSQVPVEISTYPVKIKHKTVVLGIARDITERKQAEDKLKASNERLQFLLSTSSAVIYTSKTHGNFCATYVSENIRDQLGYNPQDFTENPEFWVDHIHPEDRDRVLADLSSLFEQEYYIHEYRFALPDGTYCWMRDEVKLIRDDDGNPQECVGCWINITERKQAEQIQKVLYNISNAVIATDNLEKFITLVQKELQTIIDTTNFYIALYDSKTDTITLPFMADEKDKESSFPARKTLTHYVIKTQKPLLATKDVFEKLEKSGDVELVGPDSEIWLGVPLKIESKITGVLAVQSYTNENAFNESDMEMLEFVSDQISISIERKKAETDLKTALKKATEADRLKSAFLATMSHELRTPLNAMIGFAHLLDSESQGEEVEEFANRIRHSGDHLVNIIEDMFDITLIETGEIKITKEEQNIRPLMDDLLVMMKAEQEKLNKPGIDIRLNPKNKNKDLPLLTDHLRLKQILINLLNNAMKFTSEGVIEFGYEEKTQNKQHLLKFYVNDTGIGIPKEKQTFIFDVFRQVDDTHTRRHGGTGIGLSIAKKLTELLGGNIWLISEEGKGSTFYFTIPYAEFKKTSKPIIDKTKKKHNLTGKTVLIVEDVESSFDYLDVLLKRSGIESVRAIDGQEAIKLCKENTMIDLVLMDINMPVMNGYEATKAIKKIRPKLPVIAQTAYALAGDREKSLAAGCDDYISKPIEKEVLIEKIGNVLSG